MLAAPRFHRSPRRPSRGKIHPSLGLLVLGLLFPVLSGSEGATLFVRPTGAGDGSSWENSLNTLKSALLKAKAGDEIWAASGTYNETIDITVSSVGLYGGFLGIEESRDDRNWSMNPTVLDGTGRNQRVVSFKGSKGVEFDGFVVANGFWDYRSGSESGAGMFLSEAQAVIRNCEITRNTAFLSGGAVFAQKSAVDLVNCTIVDNQSSNRVAGFYCTSGTATLTNCILWNTGAEIFVETGDVVVRNCCVQGGWEGSGIVTAYPHFVDPEARNWCLADGSPCIDSGLDTGGPFNGAAPDLGAHETPATFTGGPTEHVPARFHVNRSAASSGDGSSWESASRTVRDVLLRSSVADEIWVASGTYNESIDLSAGTRLYGGFVGIETDLEQRDWIAQPTVLDGSGGNRHVVGAEGSAGAVIDGFTVTRGWRGILFAHVESATLANCTVIENNGANDGCGVSLRSADVTVVDCLISRNEGRHGAGLYADFSTPKILNCRFTHNIGEDGAGMRIFSSRPLVMDSTFSHNIGTDGGGATLSGNHSTLINCVITDNTAGFGAGLQITDPTSDIVNCTIARNRASFGGGIYSSKASTNFVNCIIADNEAYGSDGGGGFLRSEGVTFTNCTIAGNVAVNRGSGLFGGSNMEITNTILWNPGDTEILGGPVDISYSLGKVVHPGEGNITGDPLFVDPANGDWRLAAGSPAIDLGHPDEAFNDGCRPPGLGALRNDIGAFGGPLNCGWPGSVPPPTPTPTSTPLPTPTPTPFSPSDLTLDNKVDAKDLLRLLWVWNETILDSSPEDLAPDMRLDFLDLVVFQEGWHRSTGVR